jgi:Fe-S-cluster-containing dehydrogenase component
MTIRLGLYEDETSNQCKWHLPRAHYLESWGDARAWDGTAGIVQPLIMPLYNGKSIIEALALIVAAATMKDRPTTLPATQPASAPATTQPDLNAEPTEGHEIVRRTWSKLLSEEGFDLALRKVVEKGWHPGSEFPAAELAVKATDYPASAPPADGFYLRFQPDSHAYDGRFANNGWLQETPDPLTKLVWDNAAMISKRDADKLGATTGTIIRIETPERSGNDALLIAAYVMPGQPDGLITLPLGYGRTVAGHIGDKLGFDVYSLRTSRDLNMLAGAKISLGPGSYRLVATQDHHIMDTVGAQGRDVRIGAKDHSGMIIHEATLTEFKENPRSLHGLPRKVGLQLFQEPSPFNDTHAWGMAVDMNACIGCNACAVACQAENNIPIVGKEQADMHRAMNWIRIDRYFKGDSEDPNIEVVYQPMMCQQCENAPCEQVCPVGATVHDSEGLNTMVYNRCIGTRYCSNNCPYKVRRFNYLDYHSQDPRQNWAKPYLNIPDLQQLEQVPEIKRLMFNPDVTVRMRGVMEKCTYCVQRIHRATIARRADGSDVVDGDIVTACQQACPTQAIIFGNLNDNDSTVSRLHRNMRAYGVLHEELDTRPRTKYLAKIRNPNGEPGKSHEET